MNAPQGLIIWCSKCNDYVRAINHQHRLPVHADEDYDKEGNLKTPEPDPEHDPYQLQSGETSALNDRSHP